MTDSKRDDEGDKAGDKAADKKAEVVAFEQAKSPHDHARKTRRMATMQRRFRSATKQILAAGRRSKGRKKGKGKKR